MSDSDSTWPATDDFGSRFLEIDEYEQFKESQETSPSLPRFRPHRGSKDAQPEVPTRRSNEVRANRGQRLKSYIALEESTDVSDDDSNVKPVEESKTNKRGRQPPAGDIDGGNVQDDDNDEEMDKELSTFRNPKLMTARQLSLKMQRSATSGGGSTDSSSRTRAMATSTLLTLESLEPAKPASKPTPEQLFARQQRIERRRESAKRKAEMEKQQTVERLLKINVNSVGLHKRGRGRGRAIPGRPGFPRPASTSHLGSVVDPSGAETNEDYADGDDDNEENDASDQSDTVESRQMQDSAELDARRTRAEQHGLNDSMMDPPPAYIRWISSSRLTPCSRVCFGSDISPAAATTVTGPLPATVLPDPKPPRLCELGCGRLRRYTCSTTGRGLCSLACYKRNLAQAIPAVNSSKHACAV